MKNNIIKELKQHKDGAHAAFHSKFFKTFEGGYGEGDIFWGLKVPQINAVGKKYYKDTSLKDAETLLNSPIHEIRFAGAVILVYKMDKAKYVEEEDAIYKTYLNNVHGINNWDLVDRTAPYIPGRVWYRSDLKELWRFANSKNLWLERISVMSTFYFIRQNKFDTTIELADFFIDHEHDLMHKATGWMLREIGNRDKNVLVNYLENKAVKLPRTALRYSIEKFSDVERKYFMTKR